MERDSSSLKFQELKFIRRPELTSAIRLELGIAGLGPQYRDCTIAELCTQYNVSHEFIYCSSRLLRKYQGVLFGIPELSDLCDLAKVLESMRFVIETKIETQGSLQGISNLSKNWGGSYGSTSFISQALEVAGSLLPNTYKQASPKRLSVLCDEVYSGGRAILVTLDAQSMAVLDIQLLDKSLTAAAWEERFKLVEANNTIITELIKDQGKAMQSAVTTLPASTVILADTFHAIPKKLGIIHNAINRQIVASLAEEEKRTKQVLKAVGQGMQDKQVVLLIEAEVKSAELKSLLDWFNQAYFVILQQLRPFTSKGEPRAKQAAQETIEFALQILELLDIKGIKDKVKSIRKLLKNGELLAFMDKVPLLYEQCKNEVPEQTLWLWMLYWVWWKKAFQTHSPKVQKRAKQEALAAQGLLQEYYAQNPAGQPLFEQVKVELFTRLDTIVQASSLVETFNSILKPFIRSARGQLSQALLNLVMFYHNHRVFQDRCKRGGKSPIEIMTGQPVEKHWLDLIMDTIQAAFQQHGTTSLKELHQVLCGKKQNELEKRIEKTTSLSKHTK